MLTNRYLYESQSQYLQKQILIINDLENVSQKYSKMDKRKNIIDSLNTIAKRQSRSNEERIQFLKMMKSMDVVLIVVCGGIIATSILSYLFGYHLFSWSELAIIVMIGLGLILSFPSIFYELRILKHREVISRGDDFNEMDVLNEELKSIIDGLNTRFEENWITTLIGLFIMAIGAWQMFVENANPYWNYMKIPTAVFSGIIIVRFIFTYRKLSSNIKETEKYCN